MTDERVGMNAIRLYLSLTRITLSRFCRQGFLLAGLAVLCIALPALAGQVAEQALSHGVDFSGLTLAITAPEGDSVPELVEDYLAKMSDIRQYCQIKAMAYDEALSALERGDVTAVVALPENFVRGVQHGDNPGVRIIVDGTRPLESLLTLWVGRSASDLLAAVQAGIYAVSEIYDEVRPDGLSRGEMLAQINLSYIRFAVNRSEIFKEKHLLPTDSLPIATHYTLCLFAFLVLAMAPLFSWNYQGTWLSWQRRLVYVRRSPLYGFFAALTCCVLVLFPVLLLALVLAAKLPILSAVWVAFLWAVLAATIGALCALVTENTALCGALSFLLSLVALLPAGGIVPPVLLPEFVRSIRMLSPISWMLDSAALALGCPDEAFSLLLPVGAAALIGTAAAVLYVRRVRKGGRGK